MFRVNNHCIINYIMNIYISGITGTGLGPLALMAKRAGLNVWGTDLAKGAIYDELVEAGIEMKIGPQDGEFLKEKLAEGVDWFVYTSALKEDHAELVMARAKGVKCTKRDDFTEFLVEKLRLKMVAVAGTHGKTTTTAMIVWGALKLGIPVSYIVGTTLGFAPSGAYQEKDKYFVYEADEYDRNFLRYHPWLAVIPAVSYDHPDIYPTQEDYNAAFMQFRAQSRKVIEHKEGLANEFAEGSLFTDRLAGGSTGGFLPSDFDLAGEARRIDAALAAEAVLEMMVEQGMVNRDEDEGRDDDSGLRQARRKIVQILDEFPGVGRRFERIGLNVYSDYAHHPEEIAATLNVAQDERKRLGKRGVVVVYQPHQNTRQHKVKDGYRDAFVGADKVFWLPTYLTREDESLRVLTPEDFIATLENREAAEAAELNDALEKELRKLIEEGYIVLLMTAGPADGWMREKFGD